MFHWRHRVLNFNLLHSMTVHFRVMGHFETSERKLTLITRSKVPHIYVASVPNCSDLMPFCCMTISVRVKGQFEKSASNDLPNGFEHYNDKGVPYILYQCHRPANFSQFPCISKIFTVSFSNWPQR